MSLVNEPVAAPVIAPVEPVTAESLPPEALNLRLARESKHAREQARAELLAELGYATPEEAKAAQDAARAAKEASKSELQKATEERNALLAKAKDAEQLNEETRLVAESMLSNLTEAQRVAVLELAKDSPAAQLRTIRALSPTWAKEAAQATAIAATIPPARGATAPTGSSPSPATVAPIDHTSVWKSLSSNPFRQADYYSRHARYITV